MASMVELTFTSFRHNHTPVTYQLYNKHFLAAREEEQLDDWAKIKKAITIFGGDEIVEYKGRGRNHMWKVRHIKSQLFAHQWLGVAENIPIEQMIDRSTGAKLNLSLVDDMGFGGMYSCH